VFLKPPEHVFFKCLDHRIEQGRLVLEINIERAVGLSGFPGDFADFGVQIPVPHEYAAAGLDEYLPRPLPFPQYGRRRHANANP
jgi:hypothetical protein